MINPEQKRLLGSPKKYASLEDEDKKEEVVTIFKHKDVEPELNYHAVRSSDPVEFSGSTEWDLSQKFPDVQMAVVITMYNEGVDELRRTMDGVASNIRHISAETKDSEFWRRVVVFIVSDGRTKCDPETMQFLEQKKIMNRELMDEGLKQFGDEIMVHAFESVVCDGIRDPLYPNQDTFESPLQVVFALKERNAGKIDSHHWFFMGFCLALNPKYCFVSFRSIL
jgi:chitin synthase